MNILHSAFRLLPSAFSIRHWLNLGGRFWGQGNFGCVAAKVGWAEMRGNPSHGSMNSAGPAAPLPFIFGQKQSHPQENTGSPANPGIGSEPAPPLLQSAPGDHDHSHEESGCVCLNCSGNGTCGRRESQQAQEEGQSRQ